MPQYFLLTIHSSNDIIIWRERKAYAVFAGMAELADAQASGACGGNIVWVQVPFPAYKKDCFKAVLFILYPFITIHHMITV